MPRSLAPLGSSHRSRSRCPSTPLTFVLPGCLYACYRRSIGHLLFIVPPPHPRHVYEFCTPYARADQDDVVAPASATYWVSAPLCLSLFGPAVARLCVYVCIIVGLHQVLCLYIRSHRVIFYFPLAHGSQWLAMKLLCDVDSSTATRGHSVKCGPHIIVQSQRASLLIA